MSTSLICTEIFRRSLSDHFYDMRNTEIDTTVVSVDAAGVAVTLTDAVPAGLRFATLEILSGAYAGVGYVLKPTSAGTRVHVYQPITTLQGINLEPGTEVRISGGPLARSAEHMYLFRPPAKKIPADIDVVVTLNHNGYIGNKETLSKTSGFFVEHAMTCLISSKRFNIDEQDGYLQALWVAGLAHDQFVAFTQEYKGPSGRTRTIEPPILFSMEWDRGEDSSTDAPSIVQVKIDFTFRLKGLV